VGLESSAPLSEERQRLVGEFGAALGDTLELEEVLRTSVRAMVPVLGDLAILIASGGEADARVELAHVDEAAEGAALGAVAGAMVALRRVAQREARMGRMFRWVPVVKPGSDAFAARGDPQVIRLLDSLQVHSLIVVAVRTGGRTLGVLGLARTRAMEEYGAADLALVQVMARRIALAIEAARLRASVRETGQLQARVESALQKWTRVFAAATWGAAIVDQADRRIDVVNPAFARIHGYEAPEELTGRLFDELIVPDPERPGPWSQNVQAEAYEAVHRKADGTSFPVLVSVTPLDTEAESSYVVTVQGLSELKRAEERLRRAQRMEAVGRLAGGVAHEVNNMMTIILGFSDLLARAPELPGVLERDVDEIRKAASRAGKITQQLLAFSRQQVLQPVDLGINGVVEDLVPVLELLLPANIRIETGLTPLDVTVRADRAQLEQVLINLAFNARDAMPGGGTIRLTTEARYLETDAGRSLIGIPIPAGHYALFAVVDTGHGMDRDTLAQIFEPFFTTKPVGLGTGLGLSSVYGIVKQSGGYVWVDSTPGEGTTFTVGLPTVHQGVPHAPPPPAANRAAPEGTGTVLVIEDEEGVRELAGRILTGRGYHVLEARHGTEALARLERSGGRVDLVLTDVVVPDMATDELERGLRAEADLPILYMSGYSREEVIHRKLIRPDDPFLQKPFTADELVESVGRTLHGREEVARREPG
jgi:PAS domain S-box-containing protein